MHEDGKPQNIDLFKLVNSDGNAGPGAEPPRPIRSEYDEESEAARDDVRLFVIFLDDYHVRRGNACASGSPLIQFVKTQLGPLDMVAVMYPLMSVQQLTFTRDLEGVVSVAEEVRGPQVRLPAPEPVRGAVRELPGAGRRDRPQPGDDDGAARARGQAGLAA